jgi:hypothetical protein
MAAGIAGALAACGSARLRAPPYVRQPTEALQEAAYPPPPARVEFVPEEPSRGAVWIDGEWTWQGQRWAWKAGRWVAPPPDAAYSPSTTVRDSLGNLLVAEGKWRDKAGHDVPDPKPLAMAKVHGGTVITPEGDEVPQTATIHPDRAPDREPTEAGAPGELGDAGEPDVSVPNTDAIPAPESSAPFSPRMGAS